MFERMIEAQFDLLKIFQYSLLPFKKILHYDSQLFKNHFQKPDEI